MKFTRRNFIKLAAPLAAMLATGRDLFGKESFALEGKLSLEHGGRDFSPVTRKERIAIPSACWQCVARDAIIGYVEGDRLVKIEGNPASIRNRGAICSRGQAGVNQPYDPDRLLYPMKRMGKRGEHKWKRISWDEALTLLVEGGEIAGKPVKGLRTLRDEGHPEKFMFHYGRMKGSSSAIMKKYVLPAYGTKTIGNHTSSCEGGKWTAQELVWGKHYDINDVANTRMILNFGSNFFEAHTSHIQLAQRAIEAITENNVKLVTFDVRLSNTAVRSDEWIPVKPGTDGAIALAMIHVIMGEDLYDKDFIDTWTNVTVDQLKNHLSQYTPQWAEGVSGVSAKKIRSLAIEYAQAKPGTCISYRGAVAHYNGVENERIFKTLDAICGYIDIKGGTCTPVGAKWKAPFKTPKASPKKLKIVDGLPNAAAYPTHHVNHQVLKMIKDGSHGRPDIYMMYCYNPAYINGECQENIDVLKDETMIPFIVSADVGYSESTALADLILPDTTYLERWDSEDMVSYDRIPEYYIRQPLITPLGETRNFIDVACDFSRRLGIDIGFSTAEEFVRGSCENTAGVKEAGGFEYMKKHGVWHDANAKPKYMSYAKELKSSDYNKEDVLFDEATGVYWKWKKSNAKTAEEAQTKGYTATKNSYKGYVGQKIGDKVYKGFKPDKINKSGKFEIHSSFLEKKGFNPLPSYLSIPEHDAMGPNDLILTTYKVSVQTHSRTQNCKWLTEIYHDNPAWINSVTAEKLGIKTGSNIRVTSHIGSIVTTAQVTEAITPGVIAISMHCGHWQYGEYASGEASPNRPEGSKVKDRWWKKKGVHPNWVIPNAADPIAGQLRFMDTVVTVEKA